MFVTKHNMANAVATVSKQLENVHEALAVSSIALPLSSEFSQWLLFPLIVFKVHLCFECQFVQATKRHLTKKLENLDWKVEELKETTTLIANDVHNSFFFFFLKCP